MKLERATKQIEKELKNLSIPQGCLAYELIYNDAIAGSDIMSTEELKQYIEEYADSLPNNFFHDYGAIK